ncbi:inositol phosphosphingolipids phospholipase C [[Candida] railenensis]|uniref:Inositol phosphosphingolipids phospholipase C n=1 Tax=[Candida] railenensis TaxID=45579 RepID=A0A9P0W0A7_9ASCO|nr:inositol phosphosphingolipids phospholipase C [[Candida] railenensis]
MSQKVKLLTFNCWGLKYISSLRKERLQAIAERLAHPTNDDESYDIVALQEIWCEEDWSFISDLCKEEYPYRRIFKSGIISGPGLAILSKIPIESTFLYRFPINGRSSAFFRGDWYVGKSISVTVLNNPHVNGFIPIAILNSHMHAPYGNHTGDAAYSCHRACQAWDFAKLVNFLKRAGYAVIQVGDLNSKPGSLPYKLFTVEGGLVDSWVQHKLDSEPVNPESASGADIITSPNSRTPLISKTNPVDDIGLLSPVDQVEISGVTCDSRLNTWRSFKKPHEACRLDYAFIDPSYLVTTKAKVVFTEKLPPPLSCSYSDHFGYSAEFLVKPSSKDNTPSISSPNLTDKINVYKELLLELREYQRFTIPKQVTWRKYHFFLGMFTLVLFHFVMPWATALNPIFSLIILFLSTTVAITSVLNGLIWYFGVRSEHRALQEVQMEVEDVLESTKSV